MSSRTDELAIRVGPEAAADIVRSVRIYGRGLLCAFLGLVLIGVVALMQVRSTIGFLIMVALFILALVALVVAIVWSQRLYDRAGDSAGQFLAAEGYTNVTKVPPVILRHGLKAIDTFLFTNHIPSPTRPHLDESATVNELDHPVEKSAWDSLRNAVPARTWYATVTGFAMMCVGILAALTCAVLVIFPLTPLLIILAIAAVVLIFGGLPFLWTYYRWISRPGRER